MRQPVEGVSYHRAPPSRVLGSLGKCETHSSELARAGVEGLDDAGPTPLSHDRGTTAGGRGHLACSLLGRQSLRLCLSEKCPNDASAGVLGTAPWAASIGGAARGQVGGGEALRLSAAPSSMPILRVVSPRSLWDMPQSSSPVCSDRWMGGRKEWTSPTSSLVLAKRGPQHSPERSLLHSLPPSLIPLSNICWEPAMSGRSHVCWAAGASKQTGGPALTQLLPSGGRQALIKISNL